MSTSPLRRRVRAFGTLSTLAFLALSARIAWLQLGPHPALAGHAVDNALRFHRVAPARGRILDRHGRVLADARPSVDLTLRPSDIQDADALRGELGTLLESSSLERYDSIVQKRGFQRHREWVLTRDLSPYALSRISAHLHRLPGVDLLASQQRTYPAGNGTAHLVGYLSEVGPSDLLRLDSQRYRPGDPVGRLGLERSLEEDLAGVPGRAALVVDSLGRPADGRGAWRDALEREKEEAQRATTAGADVHLSLDLDIQEATVGAMADRPGAAVMLDVRTGAILAYASSPGFDNDALVQGVGREGWRDLRDHPHQPLLDRVVRGQYPPASTFKIVTAAAALEGGVSKDFTVHCDGTYRVGRRRFRCWKRGGHGDVDLHGALMGSCDAWFYAAGLQVGPEALEAMARRFGLGPPTGFGMNGEQGGLLPSEEWMQQRYGLPWTDGDTASASIGQGIDLATPLQLAVMTAAVANDGKRVTPWLIQRVAEADGTTRHLGGSRPPTPLDVEPSTLKAIRSGMEAVVMDDHGTAHRARIEGLPFAGKTGTAQTVSAGLKRKRPGWETEDHALFVAYAPLDEPRVALAVVVEHAGGGSTHAAPVGRAMLEAWGRTTGRLDTPQDESSEVIP